MVEEKDVEILSPPSKHMKNQLHVEQSLQNTY